MDRLYAFLRPSVDAFIKASYQKILFLNTDRIPRDAAVIFTPNHCDALMDPLLVLASNRDRKVFIARADIFKKPMLRKILTFFKMIPINRIRDGIRSVTAVEETIRVSIEVLENNVGICILPEGTHRPMHSLLPIGKGIARIACGAYDALGDDHPIYIMPVGVEYGDYYRFRSTAIANIGEPFNVSEFISSQRREGMSERDIMEAIRQQVKERIQELIVYIDDDEQYEAVWELAKLHSGQICKYRVKERFDANKDIISRIKQLRERDPKRASVLFKKADKLRERRLKSKVSIHAIHRKRPLLAAILGTLALIPGIPLFLVMGAASLPVWVVSEVLCTLFKDRAFHNSVRMVFFWVVWTLLYLTEVILLFCFAPWEWALVGAIILLPAPYFVYDFFEFVRVLASLWRIVFNRRLRNDYKEIKNELKNI
ncbi:MAG TPA: 1-acyl-sn-glycerol-3-phosphate acyltransferase [Bacteroidales bacterium]|nr:1-acyl-sn-glycerol-3-phosphate acyltransferase [Bacteroidales bacterium]HQA93615.1 1-acyl-sn-glycerol-3-phosphate acyltransferase [Bacteroidales bacterium]HQP78598.1 1-acyl-sn-glycerol-3-phosphate acyltransferase [Bacteroidales bacterium]